MADTILQHDYWLVGDHGRRTRWGFWGPQQLNDVPPNYDERGPNSLEILGYLSAAYRLTGNETYRQAFEALVNDHGYGTNMVNLNITQPSDVNFSDDELIYVGYLLLWWSGRPSDTLGPKNPCFELVRSQFYRSLQRTWRYVKRYKPALWAAMTLLFLSDAAANNANTTLPAAAVAAMRAEAKEALVWCLTTYPTTMVDWPTDNSNRADVRYASPARSATLTLLPYDETTGGLLWNGNPFRTHQGAGNTEFDPSAFLYAYWIAKWINVL